MNALPLTRPLKPILGSGSEGEGAIFTALAAPAPPAPAARFADFFSWAAPQAELVFAAPTAEASAEPRPEPAPLPPIPVAPPAMAAPVTTLAPPAWGEQIRVENLGGGAIRVTGTSQGEVLAGGPGDDRLDGLGGDDIFLGSPGRDLFHGGAGHDTLRYDLLRAEVSLDVRFQRLSLEDGEDQYDGIEVIDLRDGDWILTAADPAALVQRLWLAATGHAPSAVEMVRESAALQAGATAEALAARLGAGAGEAVQLRLQAALEAPRDGRLDQPVWLPDAEALLLGRMCELALGGLPERAAFLHWLDELEAGAAPEQLAAEMLATTQAEAQALVAAAQTWML